MQQLQQLRSFDPTGGHGIEEMVALLAFGVSVESTYKGLDIEAPEWLTKANAKVRAEITAKRREVLERELREAEAEEEALKSRDERRNDVKARQERLRKQLGISDRTVA